MVPEEDYRKLVRECETELLNARQTIDRVLARLQDLGAVGGTPDAGAQQPQTGDHADACITGSPAGAPMSPLSGPRVESAFLLTYCKDDRAYRVGSRRLGLTEMERGILDLLWQSFPKPTARDFMATTLRSSPGSIEVLVSKLRQKLALLGNGNNFIESIRLQGWVLRGPLCDYAENSLQPEGASAMPRAEAISRVLVWDLSGSR